MVTVITLAPSPTTTEGLPPLQLPWELQLTPEQFEYVCQANPEAVLELSADGHLIAMTPTGGDTSARNQTLGALLWWALRRTGLPLKLFDSSGSFRLPDGAVLSPDAALLPGPIRSHPEGVAVAGSVHPSSLSNPLMS